jgi:EpsI family protein
MSSSIRFALATALLLMAGLFLHSRDRKPRVSMHPQFASFPKHLGNWDGRDEAISPDMLETLGSGDFLARTYRSDSVGVPSVSLFVAYFSNQRFGNTWHSPKNCLPGSGWTAIESRTVEVSLPGQEPFLANRYVIGKGDQQSLVYYWFRAHDRSVPSEYWAKLYLIEDSFRWNRSDGALIRFSTEITQSENAAAADQRLISLLRNSIPTLSRYLSSESPSSGL